MQTEHSDLSHIATGIMPKNVTYLEMHTHGTNISTYIAGTSL